MGSRLVVHSSWLPGTQITLANRLRSTSSAQRMSSVRSATSPATISQSSGVEGCSDSVTGLLPRWPVCRSETAHSVGWPPFVDSRPATTKQPNDPADEPVSPRPLPGGIRTCSRFTVTVRLVHSRQGPAETSGGVVFSRVRLVGAVAALVAAVIAGAVGWRGVPPAGSGGGTVELRSTAAPMETTMKSPIVATTDPRPFDACEDIPFDVIQGLGLGFTPPEHEDGLRCHFDAGNYQVAVEPIIWRTYEETLPPDAVETTIQGHRAAQYWVMKPTYHNSYWHYSCMVVLKP